MENLVLCVAFVTFATCFPHIMTQQLWSAGEFQDIIPCFGQEMTNGSFHVGRIQYTSERIYNYDQIFEGNSNSKVDCTFNSPSPRTSAGTWGGTGPYTWTIDRIDIVSSAGMDCLGGGVGFPWYRFRLYGLSYSEYQASIWITWQGSSGSTDQLTANADPAYLIRCVYEGTNQIANPINRFI